MRREATHVMSHRPYAVDLSSLRVDRQGPLSCHMSLGAVWFRRRNGVTVACVGRLWDVTSSVPSTAHEFLEGLDDGRYGGDCQGRWDGERYWGAQQPAVIDAHLALLRPMLANLPAIPEGYDGWWRF